MIRKYLTLDGLTGEHYTYAARFGDKRLPVIKTVRHLEKRDAENCNYMALLDDATPDNYAQADLLYKGRQTKDRMFRGDNCKGQNFHHKEMRDAGLVKALEAGRKVTIYIDN